MGRSPSLSRQRLPFQRALLGWYRSGCRRLPWREAPSLYKTVVSEFMLQQTQVATVLPYFERWLARFPGFAELAAASEDEVMRLWQGLGYYSRARNLHRLAREVAALPAPPRTPDEWRELPGIGPYTAAAITSIALGAPAACVDGNVVRVLARLSGDRTAFTDSASAAGHFRALAGDLLDSTAPGDHNQAMMELGALVCTRANPRCADCPVAGFCRGLRDGDAATLPRLAAKRYVDREVTRVWCRSRGRMLLHRQGAGSRQLAGIWELPEAGLLGWQPDAASLVTKKRRTITRHRIVESIHALTPDSALEKRIRADEALRWVPVAELDQVALSGPHRRWISELLARD